MIFKYRVRTGKLSLKKHGNLPWFWFDAENPPFHLAPWHFRSGSAACTQSVPSYLAAQIFNRLNTIITISVIVSHYQLFIPKRREKKKKKRNIISVTNIVVGNLLYQENVRIIYSFCLSLEYYLENAKTKTFFLKKIKKYKKIWQY